MNKNHTLLVHAKAKEVREIARTIVDFWKGEKIEAEKQFLSRLEELDEQSIILRDSFGETRKGTFTGNIRELNKQIASLFVGLKYLVKSHLHHPDELKRKDARKVWKQIIAIGVNSHKLSLEEKISGLQKLLDVTLLGELKAEVENLDGLKVFLLGLRDLVDQLMTMYRLSINEKAKRKERVQTTAQAQKVHRLLNEEIFPMLFTLCKLDPDNYGKLARIAETDLKKINQKIRTRRTMWAKRREESKGI
jgi:hypothetical protein